MSQNEPNFQQIGTFSAIREYYTKAAAYDAGFHRHSDNLTRLDSWITGIVVSVTAITSLGTFGSFFVHNPATWAKVVVFVLSGMAAALTAVRQNGEWARRSEQSKSAGGRWLAQRNQVRNLAARICDGGKVTESELQDISSSDERLVADNPPIPNDLYDQFKRSKRQEFDLDFPSSAEKHASS
jgi:hypothetical protein